MNAIILAIFDPISSFFEVVGALIVTWAGLNTIVKFIKKEFFNGIQNGKQKHHNNMNQLRLELSHKMVLGIEFFLAGDIISTVAAPTLESIYSLGGLVVIRTILSHFLSKDIEKVTKLSL